MFETLKDIVGVEDFYRNVIDGYYEDGYDSKTVTVPKGTEVEPEHYSKSNNELYVRVCKDLSCIRIYTAPENIEGGVEYALAQKTN